MNKINFRALEDDIEHFLGIELNEEKMERLNAMRDACRRIAELEPQISNPFYPFDNKQRNASVKLETKNPLWTFNPDAIRLLSELFSLADNVSICVVDGTDTIRIMFSITDMWSKFGYDNDLEHGK